MAVTKASPIAFDYAEALTNKFSGTGYEFAVIGGRVYDKIVHTYNGHGLSVHAFIERSTSKLIKAGGWNAPQKDKDGLAYRYDLSSLEGFEGAVVASDQYGSYLYKK